MQHPAGRPSQAWWIRRRLLAGAVAVVVVVAGVVVAWRWRTPPRVALPLHHVGELVLPGASSRFDYAALDADRGLLFIAHLGASELVEVDVHAGRVVRVIPDIADVHGVMVVPSLHRVYATATGVNQVVVLDEDTGQVLARGATGDYPDGLAYDPVHAAVWTTNESGGSETVVDAATAAPRAQVDLGGEAGNVAYDPTSARMLVDVQTRNQLAVIDPATLTVTSRVPLPSCDHDHGLALDVAHRLAFVACDANATLLSVDLDTWAVLDTYRVGNDPDVLAFDPAAGRLHVAAESGWLTVLTEHDRHLRVDGRNFLAAGAHVVAVDPTTGRSFYPVPHGRDGHPALLTLDPNVTAVAQSKEASSKGIMLVYWHFRCDQNHAWEVILNDAKSPDAEAYRCPVDDSDAVTAQCQHPADRVRIEFIPAARIVDAVKGTVGKDSEYFLQISAHDDSARSRS